jgi:hypothetical protein
LTYSNSSPGTASGLLDSDIVSAVNAAGNLAEAATIADVATLSQMLFDGQEMLPREHDRKRQNLAHKAKGPS